MEPEEQIYENIQELGHCRHHGPQETGKPVTYHSIVLYHEVKAQNGITQHEMSVKPSCHLGPMRSFVLMLNVDLHFLRQMQIKPDVMLKQFVS